MNWNQIFKIVLGASAVGAALGVFIKDLISYLKKKLKALEGQKMMKSIHLKRQRRELIKLGKRLPYLNLKDQM